jgi:hypothetical protein
MTPMKDLQIPPSNLSDNSSPLPWWEGIEGRGKQKRLTITALFSTPTLTLPRQGGGEIGVVGQGIEACPPLVGGFRPTQRSDNSFIEFALIDHGV